MVYAADNARRWYTRSVGRQSIRVPLCLVLRAGFEMPAPRSLPSKPDKRVRDALTRGILTLPDEEHGAALVSLEARS